VFAGGLLLPHAAISGSSANAPAAVVKRAAVGDAIREHASFFVLSFMHELLGPEGGDDLLMRRTRRTYRVRARLGEITAERT
jgi:hypothetical protein